MDNATRLIEETLDAGDPLDAIPGFTRQQIKSSLVIEVGGRKFQGCADTTYEQDLYVMQLSERCGLEKLAQTFDPKLGKLDEFSTRMILQAFESGQLWDLLGASLEEVGKDWTMPRAKANADFFRTIKRREDKAALRNSIVAIVISFFVKGLLSSVISRTASQSPTTAESSSPHGSHSREGQSPVIESLSAVLQPQRSEPSSADHMTSEIGTKSLERSQDTTSGDIEPS